MNIIITSNYEIGNSCSYFESQNNFIIQKVDESEKSNKIVLRKFMPLNFTKLFSVHSDNDVYFTMYNDNSNLIQTIKHGCQPSNTIN